MILAAPADPWRSGGESAGGQAPVAVSSVRSSASTPGSRMLSHGLPWRLHRSRLLQRPVTPSNGPMLSTSERCIPITPYGRLPGYGESELCWCRATVKNDGDSDVRVRLKLVISKPLARFYQHVLQVDPEWTGPYAELLPAHPDSVCGQPTHTLSSLARGRYQCRARVGPCSSFRWLTWTSSTLDCSSLRSSTSSYHWPTTMAWGNRSIYSATPTETWSTSSVMWSSECR